jgi:hypothetical protein
MRVRAIGTYAQHEFCFSYTVLSHTPPAFDSLREKQTSISRIRRKQQRKQMHTERPAKRALRKRQRDLFEVALVVKHPSSLEQLIWKREWTHAECSVFVVHICVLHAMIRALTRGPHAKCIL